MFALQLVVLVDCVPCVGFSPLPSTKRRGISLTPGLSQVVRRSTTASRLYGFYPGLSGPHRAEARC